LPYNPSAFPKKTTPPWKRSVPGRNRSTCKERGQGVVCETQTAKSYARRLEVNTNHNKKSNQRITGGGRRTRITVAVQLMVAMGTVIALWAISGLINYMQLQDVKDLKEITEVEELTNYAAMEMEIN
jgi:hypothetical protein